MKKSQSVLIKLANKFHNKYGQGQSIQQIIESAASYGEQSPNGIMNYPEQLKKDKANLSVSVTISSRMMGGKSIQVSTPTVTPYQLGTNYTKLPMQIKKYLEAHINSFPQIVDGTYTIEYQGNPTDTVAAN